MAVRPRSIMALLNEIHTDRKLVLPDLQRDFVWREDQIRLLMDSIMRGYPFGSLLFWQTRFLEVPYREFVRDFEAGQRHVPQLKAAGQSMEMVLDGQQRLQALYIGLFGSHSGRRLYFNVTRISSTVRVDAASNASSSIVSTGTRSLRPKTERRSFMLDSAR